MDATGIVMCLVFAAVCFAGMAAFVQCAREDWSEGSDSISKGMSILAAGGALLFFVPGVLLLLSAITGILC